MCCPPGPRPDVQVLDVTGTGRHRGSWPRHRRCSRARRARCPSVVPVAEAVVVVTVGTCPSSSALSPQLASTTVFAYGSLWHSTQSTVPSATRRPVEARPDARRQAPLMAVGAREAARRRAVWRSVPRTRRSGLVRRRVVMRCRRCPARDSSRTPACPREASGRSRCSWQVVQPPGCTAFRSVPATWQATHSSEARV